MLSTHRVSRRSAMVVPPAGPAFLVDAPVAVGPEVLAAALDAAAEGTVLLDERDHCLYANPAACTILGVPAHTLLGRPSPFTGGEATIRPRWSIRRSGAGSPRERELEHSSRAVTSTDGRHLTVVTFRDVTDIRTQRRRFTA